MPAPAEYRLTPRPRHLLLAALIVLLVAANYVMHRDSGLAVIAEGQTLSWRFQIRGPVAPPDEVAILAIDDATIAALGTWPIPRRKLAEAINKLEAAGTRAIAMDLLISERRPADDGETASAGDRALAQAIGASRRTVLPLAFTFDPDAMESAPDGLREHALKRYSTPAGQILPLTLQASSTLAPLAGLRADAELGHVNVVLDPDGALRLFHPLAAFDGDVYPAMPLVALRIADGLPRDALHAALGHNLFIGERSYGTDLDSSLALNFYGPRGGITTYPLIDLLEGRIDTAALNGRIVLIGSTGTGLGDTFQTPYSRLLPGVEAFATATANLVDGNFLRRGAAVVAIDILAIVLCGMLAGLLGWIRLPVLAFVAALGLMTGWMIVASLAFSQGAIWLNVTFPLLAVALNATIVGLRWAAVEYRAFREGERQRGNLARYVPEHLAEVLANEETPAFDNRAQHAAILFIDLAGFTGLSEELGPEATVAMLREFHGRVETTVNAHGGTVEKFMGDGAMVIFGVPEQTAEDAPNALACARALVSDIETWNQAAPPPLRGRLRLCAGVNYGAVVIARLGSARHLQLTATGDTVNVASRLEALTRQHDAAIAASRSLIEAVREAGRTELISGFKPLPAQEIRGRRDLQEISVLPRASFGM